MMGIVACLVKDARDRRTTNKETGTRWTVSPAGHLTYQPIVWFIVPLFYNWQEPMLAHITPLLHTGQPAEYGSAFSLLRLLKAEMCTWVVPWPERLVAGLSARRSGFITRPIHVGFCGENEGSKTGFLWELRLSPAIILRPVLHNHSIIHHRRYIISVIESIVKQRTSECLRHFEIMQFPCKLIGILKLDAFFSGHLLLKELFDIANSLLWCSVLCNIQKY
jgi:hypothetical protein